MRILVLFLFLAAHALCQSLSLTATDPTNTLCSAGDVVVVTPSGGLFTCGAGHLGLIGLPQFPPPPPPPAREVSLLGTQIGTPGSYNNAGNTIAKVFDLNLGVNWDAPTAGAACPGCNWAGMDMGAPVQVTRYRVAARRNGTCGVMICEDRLVGAVFQASNTADFSSGVVTLDTIPIFPYNTSFQMNERPVSTGGATYRYYRIGAAVGSYGSVAEMEMIGLVSSGVPGRPVAPVISPGSASAPGGASLTVSIASSTTSALIYYTLDGSTPTTSSTLYSGSFSLTPASTTTLKAIAYDASLSSPTSLISQGFFHGYGFHASGSIYETGRQACNPEVPADLGASSACLVPLVGGAISGPFGGRYYWVGQSSNIGNIGTPDTGGNHGIYLYSSPDLYSWTFESQILDNAGWTWVERPRIVFNASTSTYVLWAHLTNAHNSTDRAGVATATAITGHWAWVTTSLNPDGLGFKDDNLFVDDDGTGYVIYTAGNQADTIISRLAADYKSTSGTFRVVFTGAGREGHALFKRMGEYFLVSSSSNYYNSNATYDVRYATTTDLISGTVSSLAAFWTSDPVGTANNGQSSAVFKVAGKTDAFVLMTDHFSNTDLYATRQAWWPLSFPSGTSMAAATSADWDLSIFP